MNNTPDITPENRMLRLEYDELKKKFASLTLTFEEMVQEQSPRLSAMYLKLLGNKRYEILNVQVEIKTLEMRKQLLQSYTNRNQTPDLKAIAQKVDAVVNEYNQILAEEAQKLKDAKEILEAPVLSEKETAEIRTLYRMLVKHLHPDTNPDQSDKDKDLFIVVQNAYQHRDIAKLQEICLALDTGKITGTSINIGSIKEYIDKLKPKVAALEQKIADLGKMFPFTIKDNLLDDNWIKQEQQKDEETLQQLKEKRDHLAKIVEMMELYKSKQL